MKGTKQKAPSSNLLNRPCRHCNLAAMVHWMPRQKARRNGTSKLIIVVKDVELLVDHAVINVGRKKNTRRKTIEVGAMTILTIVPKKPARQEKAQDGRSTNIITNMGIITNMAFTNLQPSIKRS